MTRATSSGLRLRPMLLLLSLACCAGMSAGLWFGYHQWEFVAWVLSLGLLLGAVWEQPREPLASTALAREPWTRAELAGFVLIIGVAAFFRLYRLDSVPPGLWIDECNVAGRARQLMQGSVFLPFGWTPLTWLTNWVHTSNLYLYAVVGTFKIFGSDYWGIKMVSVVPGILGVPLLYLFCRQLMNKQAAMCAGFFFAVGNWNVRLSRWGWDEVAMTTLQIASYYFLLRGLRRRALQDLVWAGIVMGLCLYTYIASRLALAAALACFGVYVLSRWGSWWSRTRPLCVFALATLLMVAPQAVFYVQHPNLFGVRTHEVSILRKVEEAGTLRPLWDNVQRYLLMFHVRGDWISRHSMPYKPVLDPVTGALFVVGGLIALWKWKDPGYLLCHCWLWFGLMAGILSENGVSPHTYRTGNVAPVAMVLAALPIGWMLAALADRRSRLFNRTLQRAGVALTGLLIVAIGWLNFQNYFVTWANLPIVWDDLLIARGTGVARYIQRHGHGRDVYIQRTFRDGCIPIKDPPIHEWDPDLDPPPKQVNSTVLYFVSPSWRVWVEGTYRHVTWAELKNPSGVVYSDLATIPASEIAASVGLHRYLIREGKPPTEAADSLALADVGPLDGTWTVFDGAYYMAYPQFMTFGVPDKDLAGIWLDGHRVLQPGQEVSDGRFATPGIRSVHLLAAGERNDLPRLLLRDRRDHGARIPIDNFSPGADANQHGLRARFFAGDEWKGAPVRVVDAALPVITADVPRSPYSAIWDGSLRIDQPGVYLIGMNNTGTLTLDGRQVVQNPGGIYVEARQELSVGEHPIVIKFLQRNADRGFLSVNWIRPGEREELPPPEDWSRSGFAVLRESDFYRLPFTGSGLRARYYDNMHFEGEPFLRVLESGQWLSHHHGEHFSVELEGDLQFPSSGKYWLGVRSDDGSWLYLDGKPLIDNGGVHGIETKGASIDVTKGKHHLLVQYFQYESGTDLELLWAQDGGVPYPIPPAFLYPADS